MSAVETIYAKALYGHAKEKSNTNDFFKGLSDFCEIVDGNEKLKRVLSAPIFNASEKAALVKEICGKLGSSDSVTASLVLLANKGRIDCVSGVCEQFRNLMDAEAGLVKGRLVSAVSLNESEINKLKSTIEAKIKKKVELQTTTNRDLLGGFVVNVDGKTFDASVRSRLTRLQVALNYLGETNETKSGRNY